MRPCRRNPRDGAGDFQRAATWTSRNAYDDNRQDLGGKVARLIAAAAEVESDEGSPSQQAARPTERLRSTQAPPTA